MNEVTIFLETSNKSSSEALFVKALCEQINIVCEKPIFLGGYQNIESDLIQDKIINANKNNKKALILFDADKDIEGRRNYLEKYNQEIPIFLFPNNRDIGCFENLLEKIINPKHISILSCFEEFQKCINDINKGYTSPDIKAKMYSYLSVQRGIKNNEWDFSNTYWDWDNEYLDPLKNCIKDL